MLKIIFLCFITYLFVAQISGLQYSVFQQIQKYHPQKCMKCPAFNVTEMCGFIDEAMSVGFLKNEKKPHPCGIHKNDYHTYWEKNTCAKATIKCSNKIYPYSYIFRDAPPPKENETRAELFQKRKFLDFNLQSVSGTFVCNENGQWEHALRWPEWFYGESYKSKRIPVTPDIACLYSNYMIMNEDESPKLFDSNSYKTSPKKNVSESSSCN